ncbi:transporter, major facilitator family protein [Cooperia oncophora]
MHHERSSESASDEDESTISAKASFAALSSKEWITVVMLALANLCSTVAFSCIAPFYPDEAKKKGMTESQTGIVFGIFELVMFVMAPIFGRYMTLIGSKNMFTLGLAITGITAILFGFLNYLPSGNIFFLASLMIRILEAVGDAAFVTSSFAISAKCFPGNIAVIVGVMETFAGLGYTAGPVVGGILYEFGGFQVPFLVLGAILMVATALGWWLIENFKDDDVAGSKGMIAMLRIPVIWIMVYAVVVCAISLSFLDPTLSAHLQSFNLSPSMIGLMFLLCGGIYTLSAPIWGLLIDRFQCTTAVMIFGSAATVFSMILIGPSPLLPFSKNLIVIGISLAVLGVAAGALYIPTFQSCLDAVKEHGYDDSFRTYGCVSGVFQSAFALGGFMGPTVGGFAVEKIGFAWTTTIIGAIHVMFIITVCIFYSPCCRRGTSQRST